MVEEMIDELKEACQALIIAGNRIEAVKLYREKTGCSLKQALADLKLTNW